LEEALADVREVRRLAPGGLGGEIEDPAIGTAPEHERSDREIPAPAAIPILAKHLGVADAEGLGEAGTHDTLGVDRIDEGLGLGVEEIGRDKAHDSLLGKSGEGGNALSTTFPLHPLPEPLVGWPDERKER
jgi:hypothetical protein